MVHSPDVPYPMGYGGCAKAHGPNSPRKFRLPGGAYAYHKHLSNPHEAHPSWRFGEII
jgi:hypothetical protein